METESQLDLFADIAEFRPVVPVAPVLKRKPVDSSVSADGSVLFRYEPRSKKRIGFTKFPFARPVAKVPGYMRTEKFAPVRELVAEWVRTAMRRKTPKNREAAKDLLSRIWSATDQTLVDSGMRPIAAEARIPPIRPVGKFYDLNEVFAAVNEKYFEGTLAARITWSARVGGLSFRTSRQDPFSGEPVNVISISRGYDFKNCPLYAIMGVVYHECLHIAIPTVVVNGRRIMHGKSFRQREKLYICYEPWIKWHREVLPGNVRELMRERRKR